MKEIKTYGIVPECNVVVHAVLPDGFNTLCNGCLNTRGVKGKVWANTLSFISTVYI